MNKYPDDSICFKMTGAQYLMVNPCELLYLEADREVSHIFLTNGERLTTANHLGHYKPTLMSKYGFLAISKSLLVNKIHIVRYNTRERLLQVRGGKELTVANSKKDGISMFFRQLERRWEQTNVDSIDE
jgi:DNA-binding LytR/AlgR family response regulator